MTGLKIEPLVSERGFRLSGELDLFTASAARATLEPELHGKLVLDLSGLDFIDDSGLGFLLGAVRHVVKQDGVLILRNPVGVVRRVFEVTGLAEVPWVRLELEEGGTQGSPPAAPG